MIGFIVAAYCFTGLVIGHRAVARLYPINRPDRLESGCVIVASVAAWPLFLLIWITGTLFDKTSNY